MKRPSWVSVASLAPLVLAWGCNKDKDGDDSAPGGQCNVEITETLPVDGATDACFSSGIEFAIAGGDESGQISLVDSAGNPVPGTTTPNTDGSLLVFEPDAPLAPSTAYTATLDYCLGTETLDFTTSAYGLPLTDAEALVGNVYVVDLKQARFNKPLGVADTLQTQLQRKIFLQVEEPTSATGITMTLAVANVEGTAQDPCVPTVTFEKGTLTGSAFEIGPSDVTLIVAGDPVDIGGLEATGNFAPDGQTFGCGGFTGLVDTRALTEQLGGEKGDDGFVCRLVGNYGADCVPCSDGETFCLDLEVDHVLAPVVPGLVIEHVDKACK